MKAYLPFVVVGVTSGSIYALAGMGLVLTFKTSGIFNFSHGAQAALAAFLLFEFRQRVGLPWPFAALLALAVAGVGAGLVLERIALALADAPLAARVGATVGLLVGIQGALFAVFGVTPLRMAPFLPTHLVRLPGVNVRVEQLIIAAFVLGAAIGLYWFLNRTRLGVATMGVVDDPNLLGLQGTSPTAVRRSSWVIGSSFAAISGMLLAPTIGLDAGILTLLVFYAFGAAAVGAFNSLPLTYVGGVAIGLCAAILTKSINSHGAIAALPSTLPFLVLFVALLVTPRHHLVERGTHTVRRALPPLKLRPPTQRVATVVALAALVLVPHVVGAKLPLYTTGLGFVVLFASLSLLVRTSGQISLCQMTFAAVGAATFAHVSQDGLPWPLAVLVGGLVAVPIGAVVAIPAVRLSGVYLAVATFGFGLLVQVLVFPSWLMFSNFTTTVRAPRPHLGLLHTQSDTGYFYVVLVVATLCCALIIAVQRGRLGRLLRGLADAPVALDAHGANANLTKLWVFCISAFLAGVAGAVLSPIIGSVSAPSYDFTISLLLVAVLFIAGRQPILGAFVAAAIYIVIPGYVTSTTALKYVPVVFGAGAVLAATVGGRPVLERLRASRRFNDRLVERTPTRARWQEAAA